MNLKSSSGYPYILEAGATGKSKMLNQIDEIDGKPIYELDPEIKEIIKRDEEQLKEGKNIVVFLIDSKKDEKRTIAKVQEGSTRLFQNCNFNVNFLIRKYFQRFISHCYMNCTTGPVAVGINPHSEDWKVLWTRLNKAQNNRFIAGDYGKYDKRMPYSLMMEAVKVVNDFYDDEYSLVREKLIESIISGFHIVGTTVYRAHHGMPSGMTLTSTFNSIINSILFRLAFLEIGKNVVGNEIHTLFKSYDDLVEQTFFGDDHVLGVATMIPWYNMQNISKYYESIGLEYTTTSKKEVDEDYTDRKGLWYLKRQFIDDEGKVKAPIDFKDVLTELWNWMHKTDNETKMMEDNIDTFFLELSHHPRKFFEIQYEYCRKKCIEKGFKMKVYTYDECVRKQTNLTEFAIDEDITSERVIAQAGAMTQEELDAFLRDDALDVDERFKNLSANNPEDKEIVYKRMDMFTRKEVNRIMQRSIRALYTPRVTTNEYIGQGDLMPSNRTNYDRNWFERAERNKRQALIDYNITHPPPAYKMVPEYLNGEEKRKHAKKIKATLKAMKTLPEYQNIRTDLKFEILENEVAKAYKFVLENQNLTPKQNEVAEQAVYPSIEYDPCSMKLDGFKLPAYPLAKDIHTLLSLYSKLSKAQSYEQIKDTDLFLKQDEQETNDTYNPPTYQNRREQLPDLNLLQRRYHGVHFELRHDTFTNTLDEKITELCAIGTRSFNRLSNDPTMIKDVISLISHSHENFHCIVKPTNCRECVEIATYKLVLALPKANVETTGNINEFSVIPPSMQIAQNTIITINGMAMSFNPLLTCSELIRSFANGNHGRASTTLHTYCSENTLIQCMQGMMSAMRTLTDEDANYPKYKVLNYMKGNMKAEIYISATGIENGYDVVIYFDDEITVYERQELPENNGMEVIESDFEDTIEVDSPNEPYGFVQAESMMYTPEQIHNFLNEEITYVIPKETKKVEQGIARIPKLQIEKVISEAKSYISQSITPYQFWTLHSKDHKYGQGVINAEGQEKNYEYYDKRVKSHGMKAPLAKALRGATIAIWSHARVDVMTLADQNIEILEKEVFRNSPNSEVYQKLRELTNDYIQRCFNLASGCLCNRFDHYIREVSPSAFARVLGWSKEGFIWAESKVGETTFLDDGETDMTKYSKGPPNPFTDSACKPGVPPLLKDYTPSLATWTATSTGILYHCNLVEVMLSDDDIFTACNNYEFITWDAIELQIRINGTPYNTGMLAIVGIPNTFGLPHTSITTHINDAIFMHASESVTKTISFPWISQRTAMPLTRQVTNGALTPEWKINYSQWHLSIFVMIPLSGSTTTVQPLTVNMLTRFINPKLHTRCVRTTQWQASTNPPFVSYELPTSMTHTINFESALAEVSTAVEDAGAISYTTGSDTVTAYSYPDDTTVEIPDTSAKPDAELEAKTSSDSVSTWLSRISNMASYFMAVPDVGIGARILTGITGAGSILAKAFGYQKPLDERLPSIVGYTANRNANTRGITYGATTGFDPDQRVGMLMNVYGGRMDDMVIASQLRRWGFNQIFSFSETSAPGAILTGVIMHPLVVPTGQYAHTVLLNQIIPGSGSTTGALLAQQVTFTNVYHTPLSYFAMLNTHWRGSIEVKLIINATALHSGRIRVTWFPKLSCSFPNSETRFRELNKMPSYIVDITGPKEVVFVFPYEQPQHYLSLNKIGSDPFTSIQANGHIKITCYQPLNFPITPMPPVKITVLTRAGPDLQLFGFTTERLRYREARAQSAQIPVNMCFGEEAITIKDYLLRRETLYHIENPNNYTTIPLMKTTTANSLLSHLVKMPPVQFFVHFGKYYRAWRGGRAITPVMKKTDTGVQLMRATIIPDRPDNAVVTGEYDFSIYANFSTQLGEATIPRNALVEGTGTIIHPYNTPEQAILTGTEYSVNGPVLVLYTDTTVPSGGKIGIEECVADDFSFHRVIGPPVTAYLNTTQFMTVGWPF